MYSFVRKQGQDVTKSEGWERGMRCRLGALMAGQRPASTPEPAFLTPCDKPLKTGGSEAPLGGGAERPEVLPRGSVTSPWWETGTAS